MRGSAPRLSLSPQHPDPHCLQVSNARTYLAIDPQAANTAGLRLDSKECGGTANSEACYLQFSTCTGGVATGCTAGYLQKTGTSYFNTQFIKKTANYNLWELKGTPTVINAALGPAYTKTFTDFSKGTRFSYLFSSTLKINDAGGGGNFRTTASTTGSKYVSDSGLPSTFFSKDPSPNFA